MAALPLNVGHIPDVLELKNGTKAKIPDRFVRDLNERPLLTIPSHLSSSIPVIDLSKLMKGNKEEFHDEMLKFTASCEEWGFFQVINHGIDLDLLDKMEKLAKEFFMLPIEEKQKYPMIPGGKIQGYGQAFVFSEDQKLDWCNMYALCIEPDHMRSPELWTTNPPAFGNTLDTYSSELKKILKELLRFVALSLGLNDNIFEEMFGVPVHSIRMNYYPPCPRPDLVMGLSSHSDGSALTLLQQNKDSSVGLQILKNKSWVPVQLVPNALVINIGDTIEVLSNGRYKSVEHRAVTDKENDRLTLVTFYAPSLDIEIAPIPKLVDEDNPAKYKKYNHGEYTMNYCRCPGTSRVYARTYNCYQVVSDSGGTSRAEILLSIKLSSLLSHNLSTPSQQPLTLITAPSPVANQKDPTTIQSNRRHYFEKVHGGARPSKGHERNLLRRLDLQILILSDNQGHEIDQVAHTTLYAPTGPQHWLLPLTFGCRSILLLRKMAG
nr:protein SRG1 [Tanacetum cinerariifolium]